MGVPPSLGYSWSIALKFLLIFVQWFKIRHARLFPSLIDVAIKLNLYALPLVFLSSDINFFGWNQNCYQANICRLAHHNKSNNFPFSKRLFRALHMHSYIVCTRSAVLILKLFGDDWSKFILSCTNVFINYFFETTVPLDACTVYVLMSACAWTTLFEVAHFKILWWSVKEILKNKWTVNCTAVQAYLYNVAVFLILSVLKRSMHVYINVHWQRRTLMATICY